jgi:hypothetical protein
MPSQLCFASPTKSWGNRKSLPPPHSGCSNAQNLFGMLLAGQRTDPHLSSPPPPAPPPVISRNISLPATFVFLLLPQTTSLCLCLSLLVRCYCVPDHTVPCCIKCPCISTSLDSLRPLFITSPSTGWGNESWTAFCGPAAIAVGGL